MTIVINFTIQIDAGDVLVLGERLLEQLVRLSVPPPPSTPMASAPAAPPRTLKPRATVLRPAKRPAVIDDKEPAAQEGQEATRTDVRYGNTPDPQVGPQIEPLQPATQSANDEPLHKKVMTGDRLPFESFDKLVRKEVKRLALDGRIPSARLWDSERDPRLPTLGAVMARYNTRNLATFAAEMGMQPPLSAKKFTISPNGADAIYSQSEEPTYELAA